MAIRRVSWMARCTQRQRVEASTPSYSVARRANVSGLDLSPERIVVEEGWPRMVSDGRVVMFELFMTPEFMRSIHEFRLQCQLALRGDESSPTK